MLFPLFCFPNNHILILCAPLYRYPEFDFILIGDNGQGDVRTAELINADKEHHKLLLRTYIHEVQSLHKTYTLNVATRQRTCPFIFYFTTYIDAAIDAYQRRLIKLSGLRRVVLESVADFEKISWSNVRSKSASTGTLPSSRNVEVDAKTPLKNMKPDTVKRINVIATYDRRQEARLLEMNSSICRANLILEAEGLAPVKLLRFPCVFDVGSAVVTPFGLGVVERFRPHDGTYEVMLQWGVSDRGNRGYMAYLQGQSLSQAANRSSSFLRSILSSSKSGSSSKGKDNTLTRPKDTSSDSWIAWTPYGLGVVIEERKDGIAVLGMFWGAVIYMLSSKVVKLLLVSKYILQPSVIRLVNISQTQTQRDVSGRKLSVTNDPSKNINSLDGNLALPVTSTTTSTTSIGPMLLNMLGIRKQTLTSTTINTSSESISTVSKVDSVVSEDVSSKADGAIDVNVNIL